MGNDILAKIYIQQLNDYILPDINFKELHDSCNSENNEYAKETLRRMHDVFVDIYGTNVLDQNDGFVCVPGIIKNTRTASKALALITLSVEDGGEHFGTQVLSVVGALDMHGQTGLDAAITEHLYMPYDYWYTVTIPCDHHVNGQVPEDVREIRDACQDDGPRMTMQ